MSGDFGIMWGKWEGRDIYEVHSPQSVCGMPQQIFCHLQEMLKALYWIAIAELKQFSEYIHPIYAWVHT
jgi:hypothetical protein